MRFRTAGCSTAVVTIWRFLGDVAKADLMAVLSLSLPQLVNTISLLSLAPMRPATCSRADSICFDTRPPNVCMLDGFPHMSVRNGNMASRTSGAIFVVALLST